MNKDLYQILGINKNASDAEIKKAFRNLSLKYHPDRQAGKSDSEKKEAEEKFKEISGAYAVLSDPQKKQQYDTFGTIDGDAFSSGGGFDFSGFGSMFDNFFGDMFGSSRRNRHNEYQQGQTVKIQTGVSISDILNDKFEKDIEYDIDVRCPDCNGSGGTGKKRCPHCNGTGMMTTTQRTAFGYMQQQSPCHHCNGTGEIIENKCHKCNGTGFVKKHQKVHVSATNLQNGKTVHMSGKGYEAKNPSVRNGDLIIELYYQYDQNKYVVRGNAIYEKLDVSYYDCILGGTLKHTYPNGVEADINIPAYSKEGDTIRSNKSFGRMQYFFIISVKMPTYIRESERKLLEDIRKENTKN